MTSKKIASLDLTWDEYGNVQHDLHTYVPTNEYQELDAIALCVPLVVASQLGVFSPRSGIALSANILSYVRDQPPHVFVIQYPLASAQIQLHQKEGTIVCTFHPQVLEGGTMEMEESVRRLLNNYIQCVDSFVTAEFTGYMKDTLLTVELIYLQECLWPAMRKRSFNPGDTDWEIQSTMLSFQHTIHSLWGRRLPRNRFRSLLKDVEHHFEKCERRLSSP